MDFRQYTLTRYAERVHTHGLICIGARTHTRLKGGKLRGVCCVSVNMDKEENWLYIGNPNIYVYNQVKTHNQYSATMTLSLNVYVRNLPTTLNDKWTERPIGPAYRACIL